MQNPAMDLDNLIRMANRIGDFFAPQPDRAEALAGIADHLKKFWDPRMRQQLLSALDAGTAVGLSSLIVDAIAAHRQYLQPAS